MVAIPARALSIVGIVLAGLACGTAAGQTPQRLTSPNGLETLRAEDRERRAQSAEARGQHREAGQLTEEAAGFRHNKQQHVVAAWHYFDAGDYAEMLRAARLCFAEQPNFGNAATAVRVAEQLNQGGQLDWNAVQATLRGVPAPAEKRLVPIASPEGQVALAHLIWRQGVQPGRARRILEKVAAAHPDQPEARLLLADLYRTFLFSREAARERAAAARLDPNAPRNAVYQVWRLRALGKKDEAAQKLQELTSTASGGLFEQIIELYHVAENPEEVESILSEALIEDARRPVPRLLGGFQTAIEHFHRQGRYTPLVRLLDQLREVRPQDSGLVRVLTAAHLLNGEPKRAAELVRQHPSLKNGPVALAFYAALAAGDRKLAAENAPPQAVAYVGLLRHWLDPSGVPIPDLTQPGLSVNFQVNSRHLQYAASNYLAPFELAAVYAAVDQIAAQPGAWPAQFHRAILLKDRGRLDEAVVLMRKVAEQRPDWWPPHYFLYTHALTTQQTREVQTHYEKLRPIAPPQLFISAPVGYLAVMPAEYGTGFPAPMRELREAQAQMLAGELEPAVARLQKLREATPTPDARATLGAALFALERWDEAQKEWETAGFGPRLSSIFERPTHFPTGWKPPFLGAVPPERPAGKVALTDYPSRQVAVHAAEHFTRNLHQPETGVRLIEFLLRLALKQDADYLPALYPLAHLLRQPEHRTLYANPVFRAPESRVRESDALLEKVLKQRPADLRSLWALGRFAEAARKNPDSPEGWRRVLAEPDQPDDLRDEAARELRRLEPKDIQTQRLELIRVGLRNVEEGLRRARALATETGAPEPAVLAGVFALKQGDWRGAAGDLERALVAPGGWRQRHGFTAPLLLSLAHLAAGDATRARAAARVAGRADVADPLPRLLLAYFAETDGKSAERDLHLAAAAVTLTPKARSGALTLTASANGLEVDLEPALSAIERRLPDCFPASYLLAHGRLRRSNDWPARFAGLPEPRAALQALATRFPKWSSPPGSLVLASSIELEAPREATLRLEREIQSLAIAATSGKAPGPALPSEPVQSALSSEDYFPKLLSIHQGKVLLTLAEVVRVYDARTGALVNEYRNPARYGEPSLVGGLLMAPLDAGLAGIEPLTGEVRWSLEWKPGSAKQIVENGKQAVVVANDGGVLCVSEAGEKLWEATTALPAEGPQRLAPTIDGERVYLVEGTQRVRALELKSGRELFQSPAFPVEGAPALHSIRGLQPVEGALLVLVANRTAPTYNLAALDLRDGKTRWTLALPETGLVQMVRVGDQVMAVRSGGQVSYRLDIRKGTLASAIPPAPSGSYFDHVAGPWLVYRFNAGRTLLLDPETGLTAWEGTAPSDAPALRWEGGRWYSVGRGRVDWWSERPKAN